MDYNMTNRRTIKFRVWDTEQKWYLEYYDVNANHEDALLDEIFDQSDFVFQQFTGVVTETEKEIYEGDIVSYRSKTQDRIGVVQFCVYYNGWAVKDSKAYPESDFGVERMDSPFMCFSDLKVIGNIFENPELLK